MRSYKIARLIVHMQPRYKKMSRLMQPYEIPHTERADMVIDCTEAFLRQKHAEHPHLSLEEIENIFTLSAFSGQLLAYNAMVLHGPALAFRGKGYIFSADSGVGKSTHTALWQQYFGKEKVVILNDDKPVIRLIDDEFWVFGSPWCGETDIQTNLGVPLAAVVFLKRGEKNQIQKLTHTGQLVFSLLAQTRRYREEAEADRALDWMERFIQSVRFYTMGCNMDIQAAEVAANAIVEGGIQNDTKV